MSVRVTAFTKRGIALARRIVGSLGGDTELWLTERYAEQNVLCYFSLSQWVGECFSQKKDIIFVSATGIAVRSIAPFLQDKLADPAILSVDEDGRFVVSLVSGHVGGANALARRVARLLDAQAVVSTATDVNGIFAVDEWAAKNGMKIHNRQAAKHISSRLLDGQEVTIRCDFPHSAFPDGFVEGEPADLVITAHPQEEYPSETFVLNPPILTLGVGCRKGLPPEQLSNVVDEFLREFHLSPDSFFALASIELKKDDEGIQLLSKRMNIPCYFYTAEELNRVEGAFSPSSFVHSITGTDNVCERSAVLTSDGTLLIKKRKYSGITLAVAQKNFYADFAKWRDEE